MRRNLGICVRPIERPFVAYQAQNVINHCCVGNSTPNRKFAYGSRVNSRSLSTPTRALPESLILQSYSYPFDSGPGIKFHRLVSHRVGPGAHGEASQWLSSSYRLTHLLDGAAGDAGNEAIEKEVIGDRYRDAGDQCPRHDLPPVEDVAADEVGRHAKRDRLLVG